MLDVFGDEVHPRRMFAESEKLHQIGVRNCPERDVSNIDIESST